MTMKRTTVILIVLAALSLPSRAHAQYWPSKVGGVATEESLTAQEREMLAWAREFRDKCTGVLEKWIASGEISEERLFAFLYYPMPRTDPPKFNTDWDRLSDRDIQAIEEAVLSKSSTISFAVMVDKFGYLPTHNLRYSQPLTGNTATDLVNNRTKRIFNDRTGLSAARNEAAFLIQQYQRDTGEVMFDISVPIMVKGKRWGAVRIGYRPVDAR
jgi:methyl-accepting chemotaxis protein